MAADTNAGHVGNASPEVMSNPENLAPADRADYDPSDFADQPGVGSRSNGYPRLS